MLYQEHCGGGVSGACSEHLRDIRGVRRNARLRSAYDGTQQSRQQSAHFL